MIKVKITAKREYFDKINKEYVYAENMGFANLILGDFDATYIYRTYELDFFSGLGFLRAMALAVDNDLKIEFLKD